MSNYGSYPGPPQEPWGRQPQEQYGQPSDPWGGQPDPWGGAPSSTPPAGPTSPGGYPGHDRGGYQQGGYDQGGYDQGGYDQGGYQQGGYDQGYEQSPGYGATRQYEQPGYSPLPSTEPVWGEPAPPPRKGGNTALIVVVVALALLVVAGGLAAMVKLGGGDDPTATPPASSQGADPSGGADPSANASPAPEDTTDARFVKAGQCVVNDGGERDPKLKVTECGPETFEVMKRIDGPTSGEGDASGKCEKEAPGYSNWYFFDSPLNELDFVLCLKKR